MCVENFCLKHLLCNYVSTKMVLYRNLLDQHKQITMLLSLGLVGDIGSMRKRESLCVLGYGSGSYPHMYASVIAYFVGCILCVFYFSRVAFFTGFIFCGSI